jgi:5'-methylthioadenosine phosphorylase
MLAVASERSDTDKGPIIGIVGGTILLERQALGDARALTLETPYGTADLDLGTLAASGCPVALVQRHGRKRDRPPHRINHAANLAALASLGVRDVLALASTGALKAELQVPALMVPHDYINFFDTTIFDDRLVHVTPGLDPHLRQLLIEEARRASGQQGSLRVYDQGVYFQLRGPRLDTRAEVAVCGTMADCVGMTVGSEATIARELELRYAALCTLDNHAHGVRQQPVSQQAIQASASANADACLAVLRAVVARLARLAT